MDAKHPIQPLVVNPDGVTRFKENAIVRYLLDNSSITLNHIAARGFTDEDRQQFAQLIGYSLSGYSDLSYVTDEAYTAAELQSIAQTPEPTPPTRKPVAIASQVKDTEFTMAMFSEEEVPEGTPLFVGHGGFSAKDLVECAVEYHRRMLEAGK